MLFQKTWILKNSRVLFSMLFHCKNNMLKILQRWQQLSLTVDQILFQDRKFSRHRQSKIVYHLSNSCGMYDYSESSLSSLEFQQSGVFELSTWWFQIPWVSAFGHLVWINMAIASRSSVFKGTNEALPSP